MKRERLREQRGREGMDGWIDGEMDGQGEEIRSSLWCRVVTSANAGSVAVSHRIPGKDY